MSTTAPGTAFHGPIPTLLSAALLAWGLAAAAGAPDREPVTYEVTRVDGKLVRLAGGEEERLAAGERLAGGAELRTGWFSSADLAVPRAEARFHLRSRTRVRLGSEAPGVLLVLEQGRLRALFDALGELLGDGEGPERRIETPSAVLAVRGTEYGVAVGRNGATTVVVFEGVVEVFLREGPPAPVRLGAGQALHVLQGQPPGQPQSHGLTRRGWDRGETPPLVPPAAGPGKRPPGPPPGSSRRHGPPPGTR